MNSNLVIKHLGVCDYETVWQQMMAFTESRHPETPDEIWLLEHPAVFTQGQAGKPEHLLNLGNIPLVQSDRGGQVTYHGPGQLIAYILFDIQRQQISTRSLVTKLEQSIIDLLNGYHISAVNRCDAPGVYVEEAKICSIGLRIKKGCSYHGIALNVNMDLEPFTRINPCGFSNMAMTQINQFVPSITLEEVAERLVVCLGKNFENFPSPASGRGCLQGG